MLTRAGGGGEECTEFCSGLPYWEVQYRCRDCLAGRKWGMSFLLRGVEAGKGLPQLENSEELFSVDTAQASWEERKEP